MPMVLRSVVGSIKNLKTHSAKLILAGLMYNHGWHVIFYILPVGFLHKSRMGLIGETLQSKSVRFIELVNYGNTYNLYYTARF